MLIHIDNTFLVQTSVNIIHYCTPKSRGMLRNHLPGAALDLSTYCCVVVLQYQWCEDRFLWFITAESGYKEYSVSAACGRPLVYIPVLLYLLHKEQSPKHSTPAHLVKI
jgi:hypothetical protein